MNTMSSAELENVMTNLSSILDGLSRGGSPAVTVLLLIIIIIQLAIIIGILKKCFCVQTHS